MVFYGLVAVPFSLMRMAQALASDGFTSSMLWEPRGSSPSSFRKFFRAFSVAVLDILFQCGVLGVELAYRYLFANGVDPVVYIPADFLFFLPQGFIIRLPAGVLSVGTSFQA